jgi:hypothetical protein
MRLILGLYAFSSIAYADYGVSFSQQFYSPPSTYYGTTKNPTFYNDSTDYGTDSSGQFFSPASTYVDAQAAGSRGTGLTSGGASASGYFPEGVQGSTPAVPYDNTPAGANPLAAAYAQGELDALPPGSVEQNTLYPPTSSSREPNAPSAPPNMPDSNITPSFPNMEPPRTVPAQQLNRGEPSLLEQQKMEQNQAYQNRVRDTIEMKQEREDPNQALRYKIQREEAERRRLLNAPPDEQTLEIQNIIYQRNQIIYQRDR